MSKSIQKVQKSFNIRERPKGFCHPIWPLCIGTSNKAYYSIVVYNFFAPIVKILCRIIFCMHAFSNIYMMKMNLWSKFENFKKVTSVLLNVYCDKTAFLTQIKNCIFDNMRPIISAVRWQLRFGLRDVSEVYWIHVINEICILYNLYSKEKFRLQISWKVSIQ